MAGIICQALLTAAPGHALKPPPPKLPKLPKLPDIGGIVTRPAPIAPDSSWWCSSSSAQVKWHKSKLKEKLESIV